jgi:hypothetical protein
VTALFLPVLLPVAESYSVACLAPALGRAFRPRSFTSGPGRDSRRWRSARTSSRRMDGAFFAGRSR